MSACRSCGAEVFWAVTTSGKRMPVDAEPVQGTEGNVYIVEGDPPLAVVGTHTEGPTYTSHFATCPQASQHRRPR